MVWDMTTRNSQLISLRTHDFGFLKVMLHVAGLLRKSKALGAFIKD
jgi:hypothetical protein